MNKFSGIVTNMGNLYRLSDAQSRSISPENFTGEKGKGGIALEGTGANCARDLGQGWKISPSVVIKAGSTFELANVDGPGVIQQIWMTPTGHWRYSILRIYWDGQEQPAVECPVGDFFNSGWGKYAQLSSLAVCVNPGSAFNCYWPICKFLFALFSTLCGERCLPSVPLRRSLSAVSSRPNGSE